MGRGRTSSSPNNADMLQDLSDLSVLGKENTSLLEAAGINVKMLAEAAKSADELSVVLANANGEAGDDADAKDFRDQSFSYMKAAVDEIRTTGQYVFWRDEDRKKGYVSRYRRKRSKKREQADQMETNA